MRTALRLAVSVLLPSLVLTTGAEASVRKCSLSVSLTAGLLIVDEVRTGTFALEYHEGRAVIPSSVFDGFPSGEVIGAEYECLEELDPATNRKVGYLTVRIQTKADAMKRLRELIAAQERYRASRGYYAASLAILQLFGEPVNMRNIRFDAVADGWSARIGVPTASRSCSVAVGSTPPDPGATSGQIVCTGLDPTG